MREKGRYLLALVFLTACGGGEKKSDKSLIYTSFFPIQDMTNMVIYILNRIIGRIKYLT
ncbi:hypothetical protein [Criibacterium bergeronii]|uniref:hypothetical protein n=1 Tax=Criibacterium bergeronii TaxID=1871336 RepID=UPI001314F081|nr:hypothetical protein [Criibacterium bergeronii]